MNRRQFLTSLGILTAVATIEEISLPGLGPWVTATAFYFERPYYLAAGDSLQVTFNEDRSIYRYQHNGSIAAVSGLLIRDNDVGSTIASRVMGVVRRPLEHRADALRQ